MVFSLSCFSDKLNLGEKVNKQRHVAKNDLSRWLPMLNSSQALLKAAMGPRRDDAASRWPQHRSAFASVTGGPGTQAPGCRRERPLTPPSAVHPPESGDGVADKKPRTAAGAPMGLGPPRVHVGIAQDGRHVSSQDGRHLNPRARLSVIKGPMGGTRKTPARYSPAEINGVTA